MRAGCFFWHAGFIHSLTQSVTDSLMYSPTHSLIHSTARAGYLFWCRSQSLTASLDSTPTNVTYILSCELMPNGRGCGNSCSVTSVSVVVIHLVTTMFGVFDTALRWENLGVSPGCPHACVFFGDFTRSRVAIQPCAVVSCLLPICAWVKLIWYKHPPDCTSIELGRLAPSKWSFPYPCH